jgi:8-oxo-dGTP pyrophosphatase MutT (NUDIX family)
MQFRTPQGGFIEKSDNVPVEWRPTVYGLAYRDGKVLCIKPVWNDKWELPGGKVEMGELVRDGLRREVGEETPYDVLSIDENPFSFHETYFYDNLISPAVYYQTLILVFKVELSLDATDRVLGMDDGEVERCEWVSLKELEEENVHSIVWHAIKKLK